MDCGSISNHFIQYKLCLYSIFDWYEWGRENALQENSKVFIEKVKEMERRNLRQNKQKGGKTLAWTNTKKINTNREEKIS